MEYLHTMIRISDVDASLRFYCEGLGLKEVMRKKSDTGRFTLIFLATPSDIAKHPNFIPGQGQLPVNFPMIELTYNWDDGSYDGGRNFGHLAYRVENVYETCQRLMDMGVTINRPPRDGHMAFVKSPDNISIELLQSGERLPEQSPWKEMPNTGSW